jgi:hypothetical protein
MVNGHVYAATFFAGAKKQSMVLDGHSGVGDHINVIGVDGHPISDFGHGHLGVLGEQVGGHALVLGVEMVNQDEAHAGIVGEMLDEIGNRLDAIGGCTDGHDNKLISGRSRVLMFLGSIGGGGIFLARHDQRIGPPHTMKSPEIGACAAARKMTDRRTAPHV